MTIFSNLKSRLRFDRMFASGGGPPDLEELWRDFNRRLNSLFGGKPAPGGGNVSGNRPPSEPPSGKMLANNPIIWLRRSGNSRATMPVAEGMKPPAPSAWVTRNRIRT